MLISLAALALLILPPASGASQPTPPSWSAGSRPLYQRLFGSLLSYQPAWSANVRANTDNSGFAQHEPSLAVNPTNPDVVVIANKDYREGNIKRVWIEVSRDGGQTWPTQLHMPGLPQDVLTESDPVVVARDDGRFYVVCLTTGNHGIFITWSDDNGLTWQPSVAVTQRQRDIQDKPWFAIDNNPRSPFYRRIYLAWAPGGIVASYSTDGGSTWSQPQHIQQGREEIEYPYPIVAANGDVFLVHMAGWDLRWPEAGTIKYVKSTDGGVTWGPPVTIATAYQPPTPPRLGDDWRFFSIIAAAADPTNSNRLYVAWTDHRNYATNGMEVLYTASTDAGATWRPPARLSHDPTGVVRDHITPVLDVDSAGRIHALWLDRRMDPANRLFQAWYTSSTDGGATWEADSRVSDAPGRGFDFNVGLPPLSGNAAGDYWGLDAVGSHVYAAWTDTRNGEQDIYTARSIRPVTTPVANVTPTPQGRPTVAAVPIPGSGSRIFPETGKTVRGLFLDYWNRHGGLPQQGYPISELISEISDLDKKTYTVQYFERAVFEYHPENAPPFNVLLSQLGTFQYKKKYPNGAPNQKPNNSAGSALFRETGKRIGGRFLQHWQQNGGLAQQGYPISDEFTEKSDLDGKPYTVQYFERAVFEYHPENRPPHDVLLSHLGAFRYKEKYDK